MNMFCIVQESESVFIGIFTLPDSDNDPGTDICPKMATVVIRDSDSDWNLSPSLCNGNSFCTLQCNHRVWNLSPNPYPNLAM